MSAPEAGSLDILRRESAVLVVVDLQEKLLPAIAGKDRVLGNSLLLLSTEMAVYELLARSDGAAFKRLLPYLKDRV